MPVDYPQQVDLLTKEGATPVQQNCFKLRLGAVHDPRSGSLRSLSKQIAQKLSISTGSNSVNAQADKYVESAKMPIEVDFRPPSFRMEDRAVFIQGQEMKYAGWARIGSTSLSFYNFIEFPTYVFYHHWWCLCAGILPHDRLTSRLHDPKSVLRSTPDQYKIHAIVEHAGAIAGNNNQEMGIHTRWNLHGLYPISVSTEGLDNTDSGRMVRTTVDFSVDYCEPTPF